MSTSQSCTHTYEGADEQYHGTQNLSLPSWAMDDVFGLVFVISKTSDGDLMIHKTREAEGRAVLMAAQKRTAGHVRCLHEGDPPPPQVEDLEDQQIKKNREHATPPEPKLTDEHVEQATPPEPEPLASEHVVPYAKYVTTLDFMTKRRSPLRGRRGPQLNLWRKLLQAGPLTVFAGIDDAPVRALGDEAEVGPQQAIRVATAGTEWVVTMSGGLHKFVCLFGAQFNRGALYVVCIRHIDLQKLSCSPTALPSSDDLRQILVDDLFRNGSPTETVNLFQTKAGQRVAAGFLDKYREVPEVWRNIATIQTSQHQEMQRVIAEQQRRMVKMKTEADAKKRRRAAAKKKAFEKKRKEEESMRRAAAAAATKAKKTKSAAAKLQKQRDKSRKRKERSAQADLRALKKQATEDAAQHRQQIAALEIRLQQQLKTLRAEHQQELKGLNETHAQEVARIRAELTKKSHDAAVVSAIAKLTDKVDRVVTRPPAVMDLPPAPSFNQTRPLPLLPAPTPSFDRTMGSDRRASRPPVCRQLQFGGNTPYPSLNLPCPWDLLKAIYNRQTPSF